MTREEALALIGGDVKHIMGDYRSGYLSGSFTLEHSLIGTVIYCRRVHTAEEAYEKIVEVITNKTGKMPWRISL